MRADRLVAVLLLLQTRGRITAAEVATELEVSERTARRDLEALGMAGLPVYPQQGRGGGWRLAGGGRTDLSGLTADEATALFLVAGPAPASPALKAALRKLVRALPETFRERAEQASSSVVIDPTGWDADAPPPAPAFLDAVQRAVVEGEQLELGYVARDRAATTRVVQPLGVAAKATTWYLVADTDAGLRTFRIDRITAVRPLGRPVVRPADFDLTEAWALVADRVEQLRTPVTAWALVEPDTMPWVRHRFGTRLRIGPAEADGRVRVEVRGQALRAMAAEFAGFAGGAEVVEPAELRSMLQDIGRALAARYA